MTLCPVGRSENHQQENFYNLQPEKIADMGFWGISFLNPFIILN